MNTVVLKVKFGGDLRRFTIQVPMAFGDLGKHLQGIFATLPPTFGIKYIDDDGDLISVTSDIELQEAISFAQSKTPAILRLELFAPNAAPTFATPAPAPVPIPPTGASAAPQVPPFFSSSMFSGLPFLGEGGVGFDDLARRAAEMTPIYLQFAQQQLASMVASAPQQLAVVQQQLAAMLAETPQALQSVQETIQQTINNPQKLRDEANAFLSLVLLQLQALPELLQKAPEQLQREVTSLVGKLYALPQEAQRQVWGVMGRLATNPFVQRIIFQLLPCCRSSSFFGIPTAQPAPAASASTATPFEMASLVSGLSMLLSQLPGRLSQLASDVMPSPAPAAEPYRPPAARNPPQTTSSAPASSRGPAAAKPAKPRYLARFVRDVTVNDGTELLPGRRFTKTWRMRNDGEAVWPEDTRLVFVGGDSLAPVQSVAVPIPQPGEEVDVSVDMVAPTVAGRYVSYWRLGLSDGSRFGHRVWTDVLVVDDAVPASPAPVVPDTKEVHPVPIVEPTPVPAPAPAPEPAPIPAPTPAPVQTPLYPPVTPFVMAPLPGNPFFMPTLVPTRAAPVPAPTPAPAPAPAPVVLVPAPVASPPPTPITVPQVTFHERKYAAMLQQMAEMGFTNIDLNIRLLEQNNGDVLRAIHQLLSM